MRTIGESQRPAAEDLVEMLVELEPVRQDAEEEQEHGKPVEQQPRHHAGRVPDLTRHWRDEVVRVQAAKQTTVSNQSHSMKETSPYIFCA